MQAKYREILWSCQLGVSSLSLGEDGFWWKVERLDLFLYYHIQFSVLVNASPYGFFWHFKGIMARALSPIGASHVKMVKKQLIICCFIVLWQWGNETHFTSFWNNLGDAYDGERNVTTVAKAKSFKHKVWNAVPGCLCRSFEVSGIGGILKIEKPLH